MKLTYFPLILTAVLMVGCASTEKDLRITVRDGNSKENVENGRLVLNRLSFFSNGAVGHGRDIDENGNAFIDGIEVGSWEIQADIEGYDLARSGFSFSENGQRPQKGEWSELNNRRLNPNFPNKMLEFAIETFDQK